MQVGWKPSQKSHIGVTSTKPGSILPSDLVWTSFISWRTGCNRFSGHRMKIRLGNKCKYLQWTYSSCCFVLFRRPRPQQRPVMFLPVSHTAHPGCCASPSGAMGRTTRSPSPSARPSLRQGLPADRVSLSPCGFGPIHYAAVVQFCCVRFSATCRLEEYTIPKAWMYRREVSSLIFIVPFIYSIWLVSSRLLFIYFCFILLHLDFVSQIIL